MTNKDWLMTLTNRELADFILDGLPKMSRCSTQSSTWIEEWLGKEHQENGQEKWFYHPDVAICSRCGKQIAANEHKYIIGTSDFYNNHEENYWCVDCYVNFMTDLRPEDFEKGAV